MGWITQKELVTDVLKKTVALLVVAFAAFYLLTQPEAAADAVKGAAAAVADGFEQIIRFLTALLD